MIASLFFSGCFGPKPVDVCSDPQVKNQIINDWKKKHEFSLYLGVCDPNGIMTSLKLFSFGNLKIDSLKDLTNLSKKFPKIATIANCVKDYYKKKYLDYDLITLSASKNQTGNFECTAKFNMISHHPDDKNHPVIYLGNIKYYVEKNGKKLTDYSFIKTSEYMEAIQLYNNFTK